MSDASGRSTAYQVRAGAATRWRVARPGTAETPDFPDTPDYSGTPGLPGTLGSRP